MLYYGIESIYIDIPTHPAKGITYFQHAPNFFFKIFFIIIKPLVCVAIETTPYQDPPYNLRGCGYPPQLIQRLHSCGIRIRLSKPMDYRVPF